VADVTSWPNFSSAGRVPGTQWASEWMWQWWLRDKFLPLLEWKLLAGTILWQDNKVYYIMKSITSFIPKDTMKIERQGIHIRVLMFSRVTEKLQSRLVKR
jgi:hypothetical protein